MAKRRSGEAVQEEAKDRLTLERREMEKNREAFYLLYSRERRESMKALIEMNGGRCAQRQIRYLNRYERLQHGLKAKVA